jgi:hypothetical protein
VAGREIFDCLLVPRISFRLERLLFDLAIWNRCLFWVTDEKLGCPGASFVDFQPLVSTVSVSWSTPQVAVTVVLVGHILHSTRGSKWYFLLHFDDPNTDLVRILVDVHNTDDFSMDWKVIEQHLQLQHYDRSRWQSVERKKRKTEKKRSLPVVSISIFARIPQI